MTPAQIVSRFCLGESIAAMASEMAGPCGDCAVTWAALVEAKALEIEAALRHDMQWLYETEGLATQAPANLATALMQQSADHCTAIDADDWARGYRAGYATGKQESADAVGHLGNVLLARAHGVTREGNT